jgi:hypothetical protein
MESGITYRFPPAEEWPSLVGRSAEQLEKAAGARVGSVSLISEMLELVGDNGLTREQCDSVYTRFSHTLRTDPRAGYWNFLHGSKLRGARMDREAGRSVTHFGYLHELAGIAPQDG